MILTSITPLKAHAVSVGPLYPTLPEFTDLDGVVIESLGVGRQIIIKTSFSNITEERKNFLALTEVRNSEGVTVFLAWQSGNIAADSIYTIGTSWQAELSGYYYARTFAVSDLEQPEILSIVTQSEISVMPLDYHPDMTFAHSEVVAGLF